MLFQEFAPLLGIFELEQELLEQQQLEQELGQKQQLGKQQALGRQQQLGKWQQQQQMGKQLPWQLGKQLLSACFYSCELIHDV